MPKSKPQTSESVPYFQRYIQRVKGDVMNNLLQQMKEMVAVVSNWSDQDWLHSYAPNKWTLKESFVHLIDTERIFAYRILRIARGDQTPLPGFDQDDYVPTSEANARTGASLIAEYTAVRQATIELLENLPVAAWARSGVASGGPLTVRAAAYIIAGHEQHHVILFQEKYKKYNNA